MHDINSQNESLFAQKELADVLKNLEKKYDSLDLKKVKNLTEALDKLEAKHEQIVKESEVLKTNEIELKAKLESLEKVLSKPLNVKDEAIERTETEKKALASYLLNRDVDEYKSILRSDNDPQGGFLAPEIYSNEIIKKITEISNMRAVSKVSTVQGKRLKKNVRTGLMNVEINGENVEIGKSISTYGQVAIDTYKLAVIVPVTTEEIEDAAVNLEGEIIGDAGEAFAQAEGQLFVTGSGKNRPEGIMTNADIPEFANGHATDLNILKVVQMTGQLKTGYDPMFLLNRKTLTDLRVQTDSSGNFLWQPGNLAAGMPSTLGGYRYLEMPDMEDIAAGTHPIIFGDFRKAFEIVDRRGMIILRDPYSKKTTDNVEIMFSKRIGSKVVLPEAAVKLKMATSV